eukprot:COSAG03_NODE_1451_length_4060_cov_3.163848_2_plen_170_part_00
MGRIPLSPNCVEYTPFGATHLTGEIALMPRGRPRSGARPCGAGGSCSTPCFSRCCCVRWCRRAAPVSPGCTPFRRCPAAWLRGAPRSGGRGPASSSGRRRALRHERGRGGAVLQRAIVGSGCCAASKRRKVCVDGSNWELFSVELWYSEPTRHETVEKRSTAASNFRKR